MGRVQGTPTLPYPSLPPLSTMNGGCHQINLRHVKSKCHYDAPWKTPTAVVCLAPVLCHRRRRRHHQAASAATAAMALLDTEEPRERTEVSSQKSPDIVHSFLNSSILQTNSLHTLSYEVLEYLQFQSFFITQKFDTKCHLKILLIKVS